MHNDIRTTPSVVMLTGLEILVCSFTHRETRESFHGSNPCSKYRNERLMLVGKALWRTTSACASVPGSKRKTPGRPACPKAVEAKPVRRGASRRRACGSRGNFGERYCLTAGATTDHSPTLAFVRRHSVRPDAAVLQCCSTAPNPVLHPYLLGLGPDTSL